MAVAGGKIIAISITEQHMGSISKSLARGLGHKIQDPGAGDTSGRGMVELVNSELTNTRINKSTVNHPE